MLPPLICFKMIWNDIIWLKTNNVNLIVIDKGWRRAEALTRGQLVHYCESLFFNIEDITLIPILVVWIPTSNENGAGSHLMAKRWAHWFVNLKLVVNIDWLPLVNQNIVHFNVIAIFVSIIPSKYINVVVIN